MLLYNVGWWFVQKIETGECGFVPSSFIKKVGDPSIPHVPIDTSVLGFVTSTCIVSKSLSGNQSLTTISYQHEDNDDVIHDSIINTDMMYMSIYQYKASDPAQLSFPEGAEIVIIDKSEDGQFNQFKRSIQ